MNDPNASLSSLALLSLQMQSGKDYLDYLRGFVLECVKNLDGEAFDTLRIKDAVEAEFGLKIPVATFAIYLKRLVKEKVLSPASGGRQFIVNKLPDSNFTSNRKLAISKIRDVVDELAGFAYRRYSLEWDDRASSSVIANFLRGYSIDFLKYDEAKSPLPEFVDGAPDGAYIVAAFIADAAKNNNLLFDSIRVLVKSHILSNALMCPDLVNAKKGFNGVHFFVDTRFVIKVLDLESRLDAESANNLLATILDLKGNICIFPETKDELRSVLKAIVRGMQSGSGRGPVYRELLKRGRGVADVILAENSLDDKLAALKISVFTSPSYDEDSFRFQIGEQDLREEIESEIDYLTEEAATHDVRVVRNIFALRKGRRCSTIEDSGYVFLTTNTGLSRAAFNYQRAESTAWVFSAVITDFHLSHLAWLKSPVSAHDLPRDEILANCYSAMRPHDSTWNQYVKEVDRFRDEGKFSERDHQVLRFSLNAPEEMMDVTRGDVDGVTIATLHVILERLEKTFAADKEAVIASISKDHEQTKEELEQTKLQAQTHSIKLQEAATREEELKLEKAAQLRTITELESLRIQEAERVERRKTKVSTIAGRIAFIGYCFAWVIFIVSALMALRSDWSPWYAVPSGIVGVANIGAGLSGASIKRWIYNVVDKALSSLDE